MGSAGRGAVRVALATAVVLSAVALSARTGTTAVRTEAPRGALRTVAVPAGSDPARRVLPARTTEPFRMVGVTWSDGRAALGGTAQIRTRSAATGRWSPWRDLELDVHAPESGPDHAGDGLRGGTQPLWVGLSDGVQARITGAKLPAGLRVDLVDPDAAGGTKRVTAPSDTAASVGQLDTTVGGQSDATVAGQPDIVPRSGWGADESLVVDPPEVRNTKAFKEAVAETLAELARRGVTLTCGCRKPHP